MIVLLSYTIGLNNHVKYHFTQTYRVHSITSKTLIKKLLCVIPGMITTGLILEAMVEIYNDLNYQLKELFLKTSIIFKIIIHKISKHIIPLILF